VHQFVNRVIFLFTHSLKLFKRHYAPQRERAGKQVGLGALDKLRGFVKVVINVSLNYLMDILLNFFLRPDSLRFLHAATEKRRKIFTERVCIMACDGAMKLE
jgi:hypothetical protein